MAYADILFEVKHQVELTKRGPQALAALKAAFHARHRHNGVSGLSRLSIDHLVANYYHTEEAKEMGRAFNSKQDLLSRVPSPLRGEGRGRGGLPRGATSAAPARPAPGADPPPRPAAPPRPDGPR